MGNTEKEIDFVALLKSIKGEWRKLAKWGGLALLVGLVVAFSLPKEYTCVVRVAPESKSQASSMGQLGGLAAMMGVNVGGMGAGGGGIDEAVYPEIVKSAPFLNEFATMTVPFQGAAVPLRTYLLEDQKSAWWNAVLGAPMAFVGWVFSGSDKEQSTSVEPAYNAADPSPTMRGFQAVLASRIVVENEKKTGLISMKVQMQDPIVAMVVADSLYEKLSRYMQEYYTAKSRNDLITSKEMLAQAKKQYYQSDSAYAWATDRNQNLISKSAQIKIDRYKDERDIAFMVYQQLAQQVEANKIKLQSDTPIATVIEPARVNHTPASPNKKIIVIAFAFLGMLAAAGMVVVRESNKQTP